MFEKLIRVDLKKKINSFNSLFNELTWIALFVCLFFFFFFFFWLPCFCHMGLMIESILIGLVKDCYETSKDNILSWARKNHHLDKMFSFPLQ